jgi:hypothetical protein
MRGLVQEECVAFRGGALQLTGCYCLAVAEAVASARELQLCLGCHYFHDTSAADIQLNVSTPVWQEGSCSFMCGLKSLCAPFGDSAAGLSPVSEIILSRAQG